MARMRRQTSATSESVEPDFNTMIMAVNLLRHRAPGLRHARAVAVTDEWSIKQKGRGAVPAASVVVPAPRAFGLPAAPWIRSEPWADLGEVKEAEERVDGDRAV